MSRECPTNPREAARLDRAAVHYDDPLPRDWLALEEITDGWYDCEPHAPVDNEGLTGTHAQRREDFKQQMEEAADFEREGFDSRRNDPENRAAREVACPDCGASEGTPCQRPSGHTVQQVHGDRKAAAREAGLLEDDEPTGTADQVSLDGGWAE